MVGTRLQGPLLPRGGQGSPTRLDRRDLLDRAYAGPPPLTESTSLLSYKDSARVARQALLWLKERREDDKPAEVYFPLGIDQRKVQAYKAVKPSAFLFRTPEQQKKVLKSIKKFEESSAAGWKCSPSARAATGGAGFDPRRRPGGLRVHPVGQGQPDQGAEPHVPLRRTGRGQAGPLRRVPESQGEAQAAAVQDDRRPESRRRRPPDGAHGAGGATDTGGLMENDANMPPPRKCRIWRQTPANRSALYGEGSRGASPAATALRSPMPRRPWRTSAFSRGVENQKRGGSTPGTRSTTITARNWRQGSLAGDFFTRHAARDDPAVASSGAGSRAARQRHTATELHAGQPHDVLLVFLGQPRVGLAQLRE